MLLHTLGERMRVQTVQSTQVDGVKLEVELNTIGAFIGHFMVVTMCSIY